MRPRVSRLVLVVVCVLLCVQAAQTQHRTPFEQITVAGTAIGITAAIRDGMAGCLFRLETAQVRWRIDAAPTAAVGTLLEVGDVTRTDRGEDLVTIKFIRTGSTSGLLNVTCWTAQ